MPACSSPLFYQCPTTSMQLRGCTEHNSYVCPQRQEDSVHASGSTCFNTRGAESASHLLLFKDKTMIQGLLIHLAISKDAALQPLYTMDDTMCHTQILHLHQPIDIVVLFSRLIVSDGSTMLCIYCGARSKVTLWTKAYQMYKDLYRTFPPFSCITIFRPSFCRSNYIVYFNRNTIHLAGYIRLIMAFISKVLLALKILWFLTFLTTLCLVLSYLLLVFICSFDFMRRKHVHFTILGGLHTLLTCVHF